MSTLLNKSYLVKVSTKGGGGVKNAPKSVYVVCTQPLTLVNCATPIDEQQFRFIVKKWQTYSCVSGFINLGHAVSGINKFMTLILH